MESAPLLDCASRLRSPATLPGYHQGRPPRNKNLRYPPDRPPLRRWSESCSPSATDPTGSGCAA